MTAPNFDVIQEYGSADSGHISLSPSWLLAVIPIGRPVTFSRRTNKSIGRVTEGAFSRREQPLLITDDCISLEIQNAKTNHTKSLQASLKHSDINYLSQDALVPGDWIAAWCFNNEEDQVKIIDKILRGQQANRGSDGLKFLGRVHSIRRHLSISPGTGHKSTSYALQAIGFDELDTQFFYDYALATASAVGDEITQFMAQLGLDFTKFAEKEQMQAGNIKDNGAYIMQTLVDIILGEGIKDSVAQDIVDRTTDAARVIDPDAIPKDGALITPQDNKEAPFAYLVPTGVGQLLGKSIADKSKSGVFGYADIFDTVIGVQQYAADDDFSTILDAGLDESGEGAPLDFYPLLNEALSTKSRKRCPIDLKGTFLPVNPSFVNRPLYQILQQFLNPAINEMYTAMRLNESGDIVPTLVVRQIPFSTESMIERSEFPLTKFLSLPRWVIDPVMVTDIDVGRSNATRINMIHVYGDASTNADNRSKTHQLVRNPPIYDTVDIQRSGIRAMMQTVNCSLGDQVREDGARYWMEAIADWTMGSQYTLNGTIRSVGIQSAIAEGDNIEFEGIAYHIESVGHTCSISSDGVKSFGTTLQLTNGMPIDQSDATADFPRYPGFRNIKLSYEELTSRAAKETSEMVEDPDSDGAPLQLKFTREAGGVTSSVEEDGGSDGGTRQANLILENKTTEFTNTTGDNEILTTQDPGHSFSRK